MNKVDLENIKKELAKREAANYVFEGGGELSKDDIMLRTTEELTKLVEDFNNATTNTASAKIREIVDEMFAKYGEEGDNMVLLSAAFCPEREVYEVDEPFSINFNDDRWNRLYKPICRNWEGSCYWDRKDMSKAKIAEWDKKWDEYYKDVTRLCEQVDKVNNPVVCSSAEEHYEDDNEALNEYWHGVIGIMKDYRLVAFVIRDDGLLCDEKGYETFHNEVLYQF